jgi:ribosomal protein S12 methylthiotransferase
MAPRVAAGSRVHLHTLGCPKNEADSRAVIRSISRAGVSVVEEPEDATHILVNTCGFIREAKEESIAAILDAASSYPDKKVLVMGCLVERYRDELSQGIPEVAGWFGLVGGPDQQELVRFLVADAGGADPATGAPGAETAGGWALGGPPEAPLVPYAYIKISDGCDELCSFCAIPGIKGPYHAATPEEILAEADACLAEGARELVLVGQDTARWESGGMDLADLARALCADPRLVWLRVMYLQPDHLSDALLRYMGEQVKLCAYLDLPLQHSDPHLLRRMGRAGDGDSYLELLEHARRLVPGVAVRSAFIVGFPGETEDRFEHLVSFVREAEFEYAGGFVYSPEEGTPAARLKPRVPRRVARERLNRLNRALVETAEMIHNRRVGSTVEVMIDSLGTDGPVLGGADPGDEGEGPAAVGRTRGQAPEVDGVVHIEGRLPDGVNVGDLIEVTIEAAVGYDFVATVAGPAAGAAAANDGNGRA